MKTIHLCNSFFERELLEKIPKDLHFYFPLHPIFYQLQFLPFLYDKNAVVSHLPEKAYLKRFPGNSCHLLDDVIDTSYQLDSWGSSLSIKDWATKKGLSYQMPELSVLRKIHAKSFPFLYSKQLPFSYMVKTYEDLLVALSKGPYPKVLKIAFETAGRGLFILPAKPENIPQKIQKILIQEFKENRPVIVEPWVKRVLDFSTQWKIEKNKAITFLGTTIFEADQKGTYRKTIIRKNPLLLLENFYQEHLEYAKHLLEKCKDLGFFGNIGFDAFIYEENHKHHLHPIAEVNARKTMSYVALCSQKKFYPNSDMAFSFIATKNPKEGFLPQKLKISKNHELFFPHQIFLEKL